MPTNNDSKSTVSRKPVDRRTFLRGAGVALGLPMLETMLPARASAAAMTPPHRLIAIQTNQGIMPHLFFPNDAGKNYTLSPYLKILQDFRNKFTVFSGVSFPQVDGGHANDLSFLTGAPHPGAGNFKNTVSMDQIIADHLGSKTRFPSLIVSVANGGHRSMSYTRSGVMIPPEKNASEVYKQLFVQGKPEEVAARVKDLKQGRSVLDFIQDSAKSMAKRASKSDRQRMDQYFQSIREVENELLKAEDWEKKPKPQVKAPIPKDISDNSLLMDKFKQMLGLIRLALETDSTRVVSLFVQPLGVLAIDGVEAETHSLTHHGNRPEMVNQLRKIEEHQFGIMRDFLTEMQNSQESGHSLLDRTAIVYGTNMGNANGHKNTNWPMMLIGGGYKHGQHLAFNQDDNESISKIYISLLQRMGVEQDAFALNKGTIAGLEMT